MYDVIIKTSTETIREQIKEWKELKDLLLQYKDYISVVAINNERNNHERPTR